VVPDYWQSQLLLTDWEEKATLLSDPREIKHAIYLKSVNIITLLKFCLRRETLGLYTRVSQMKTLNMFYFVIY